MTARTRQVDRRAWTGQPGKNSLYRMTGEDILERKARIRKRWQDGQKMTAWMDRAAGTKQPWQESLAGMGFPGQDSKDNSLQTGQPRQDREDRLVRTRTDQLGQDNQERKTVPGQQGKDSWARKTRKSRTSNLGQEKQDKTHHERTAMTGWTRRDS